MSTTEHLDILDTALRRYTHKKSAGLSSHYHEEDKVFVEAVTMYLAMSRATIPCRRCGAVDHRCTTGELAGLGTCCAECHPADLPLTLRGD